MTPHPADKAPPPARGSIRADEVLLLSEGEKRPGAITPTWFIAKSGRCRRIRGTGGVSMRGTLTAAFL
jgi:hypothetical protein